MATKLTSKAAEQRRFRAMTLLEQGDSQAQVARQLGVSRMAVNRWVHAYERDGPAGLQARPRPGHPTKLTEQQVTQLETLLLQGPVRHGYANQLWTLKRIVELIHKHFGVTFDPSGVWRLLQRMGWSCQKPQRRARERDEQAVKAWRQQRWPHIKKRSSKR